MIELDMKKLQILYGQGQANTQAVSKPMPPYIPSQKQKPYGTCILCGGTLEMYQGCKLKCVNCGMFTD